MRGPPPRGLAPLPRRSRPRDLSAPPPALRRSSSWGSTTGTHLKIRRDVSPTVTQRFSHLRTFSMVAITFLMSSLARLRVSARTVRPAMLAGLGPRPSPRLGRLPSGGLRLGARPGGGALGLPSLRELAAPSLAPQRLRESPPRFLPPSPPRPAPPARPRSGPRRGRTEPRPGSPPAPARPSGCPDAQRPLPAARREVGGSPELDARGRAGGAFRARGRREREGLCLGGVLCA